MDAAIFLFAAASLLALPLCQGACAPSNLTMEEKLRLIARDNDHDGDGVVTSADIAYDLNTRYDSNHDGRVDEAEWVARWTCAYGDTEQYARYVWDALTQGASSVQASQFSGEPFHSGLPLTQFTATNRERYIKYASLTQTTTCAPKDLTVEEKLRLIARDNDHDGDGVVTSADIAYDLNTRYDSNHDGRVDETEWVARWTCAYGDTEQYARYVWDALTQGASSVQASQFSGEPFHSGLPLTQFTATNRERYIKYASIG